MLYLDFLISPLVSCLFQDPIWDPTLQVVLISRKSVLVSDVFLDFPCFQALSSFEVDWLDILWASTQLGFV